MIDIGYALSSEEHPPQRLVELAVEAEASGFSFAAVSDHFHPWIEQQGEASHVWTVLGAIAQATTSLVVGTGVTCPLVRQHPAIVAQAAATVESLMPGRFFLGVGTGENLNEHITGAPWPGRDQRLPMLEEAIGIIRALWSGGEVLHRGEYFTVDRARLYSLPSRPPPLLVAAKKPGAAELAGRVGDGLINTSPEPTIVQRYLAARRRRPAGPRLGEMTVCVASSESEARRTARDWWPTAALGGDLSRELPVPADFEAATALVDADTIGKSVICGSDVATHVAAIRAYVDAGFSGVYLHQVGEDQDALFAFYREEILPVIRAEDSEPFQLQQTIMLGT